VNTEPPREDPDEPRSAAQNDLASKPGQRYQPEARYREDNELLTAARAAGPDSIEELMLSAQLERLGVRTLMRMTLDGSIFREWRVRKIRLRSFPERWREERRRVVHQAVSVALPRFLRKYVHSESSCTVQGCSLSTLFITGCIFAYAEEYRRFLGEESYRATEIPVADVFDMLDSVSSQNQLDSGAQSVLNLAGEVHDKLPEVVMLRYAGYTLLQISERVGISVRHIDRLLSQLRQKAAGGE